MREMGVRGLLAYCSDFRCSHSVAINGDRWPDHVRLSDLEPLFVCQACGTRPAELRPDFDWNRTQPGNVQRPRAWRDMQRDTRAKCPWSLKEPGKEAAPARGEN